MTGTAAYSQMNGSVDRYITETTYSPDVSETSILSYISSDSDIPLDRPAGLALAADGDELVITDNSNGGTIRIPVKDGTAEIWNVAPTPAVENTACCAPANRSLMGLFIPPGSCG